jgi:AcrR family transcriptional regulator
VAVGERDGVRTRARILEAAQELFVERGYAGTSIADIAGKLGTSKATLYYHFNSKELILGALITEPLSLFAKLAERCAKERLSPEELLRALIDLTVETHAVNALLSSDPSISPVLRGMYDVEGSTRTFIHALAGPNASDEALARAWAAFAVAKQGAFWAVEAGNGTLSPAQKQEFLAAALRCLDQ